MTLDKHVNGVLRARFDKTKPFHKINNFFQGFLAAVLAGNGESRCSK